VGVRKDMTQLIVALRHFANAAKMIVVRVHIKIRLDMTPYSQVNVRRRF
jgi:hypothetical protein